MKTSLLIILLIALTFFSYSQEWVSYDSPDKTFKIEFPGQSEVMKLNSGYGLDSTKIIQYIPQAGKKSNTSNTLTIMYLSEEILKPDFNEDKKLELLKRYSSITIGLIGKVMSNEKISLSGFPGIFTKGIITQAVREEPYPAVFIKSYLIENTIYQMMVSCSDENKESQLIDYFFDSFQIID